MTPITTRQLDKWLPLFDAIICINPYQRSQHVKDIISHNFDNKREAAKDLFDLILTQIKVDRRDRKQYLTNIINQYESRGDMHPITATFYRQVISKFYSRAFS